MNSSNTQPQIFEKLANLLEAVANYESVRSRDEILAKQAAEEAIARVVAEKVASLTGKTPDDEFVEKLAKADPIVRNFIEDLSTSLGKVPRLGEPNSDDDSEKVASNEDSADRAFYKWILS